MPKPLPKELLSKAGTAPLPGTAKLPNAGAALPEVPCVDTKDECKEWAAVLRLHDTSEGRHKYEHALTQHGRSSRLLWRLGGLESTPRYPRWCRRQ